MIQDLKILVQPPTARYHEIIGCIDTNEPFIPGKSGTAKILESTKLVYPLINIHVVENDPLPPINEV